MTVGLLGFCYEFIGETNSAIHYYSLGIQAQPRNDGLLVARGILLYGNSPGAISDFEQAARLNCPVVWPYLFLAHHYIVMGRFDLCRVTCEIGLKMDGSHIAKSHLEGWRAIAQAELGFPPKLVREAFDASLRLDSSNELAKRNFAAFEASLTASHSAKWEQQSASGIRLFGLTESLAERRHFLAA